MKNQKKLLIQQTISIFILLSLSMTGNAQGFGSLKGSVSDAASGDILPAATVTIEGTSTGTITDLNGEYTLPRLREGTHKISCIFLGFTTSTLEVNIRAGETSELDFALAAQYLHIAEVVVSVQAFGQTKAINQQLNSDALVNVLSEEKIRELPDVNLAEAIGRMPGIALERSSGEGQKVIIRGLEPNFASITVNGMKLASTERDDRSSNLSLISSEMLSSVEVIKSPTPDMDADAIAGTVNIGVRKASSSPTLRVKLTNVYNAYRNDPLNYQASVIAGKRFFDQKLGVVAEANAENLNRGLDYESSSLVTYLPEEDLPFLWIRYNKQRKFEERNRYGASLNLDYKLKGGGIFFNGLYSRTNSHSFNTSNSMYLDVLRLTYNASFSDTYKKVWSAALSGKHQVLNAKIDWGLAASEGATDGRGSYTTPFELINGVNPVPQSLRILEPSVWDTAAHPDYYDSRMTGRGKFKTRNSFERTYTASGDIEIPINTGGKVGGWFKTGAKIHKSIHESISDSWQAPYYTGGFRMDRFASNYPDSLLRTSNGGISMVNFIDTLESESDFLGGQSSFYFPAIEDKLRLALDSDFKNFDHIPTDGLKDQYKCEETVIAAYAMFRLKIGRKLTVIPGVRYEKMDGEYQAYVVEGVWDNFTSEERKATNSFPEFLPHFHVKYEPLSWMDVRFAYNKTVSRPRYSNIRPYGTIKHNNETISSGNPGLKQAVSSNYDLNVSVYDGRFGLFSMGAFTKDIRSNFYRRNSFMLYNDSVAAAYGFPNYVGYTLSRHENADSKVWGYEVELQSNFNILPYSMSGLVLSVNYTRLFSQMTVQSAIRFEEVIGWDPVRFIPITQTVIEETYDTISMPDQTPHIFNVSLGYDIKGFSSRISFIYQGLRLTSVSNNGLHDYDLDTYQLDLSLKQKFGKYFSAYMNLNNLFNLRKDVSYQYELYYKTSEQQWGMNIFLGVIYDF